jgi:hypothetical protein
MPIFGEENVKGLSASLAAQDGINDDAPRRRAGPFIELVREMNEERIEIGRQLVGRTGLNY